MYAGYALAIGPPDRGRFDHSPLSALHNRRSAQSCVRPNASSASVNAPRAAVRGRRARCVFTRPASSRSVPIEQNHGDGVAAVVELDTIHQLLDQENAAAAGAHAVARQGGIGDGCWVEAAAFVGDLDSDFIGGTTGFDTHAFARVAALP